MSEVRQSGKTTSAIQDLPLNSLYIVEARRDIGYMKRLSRHIGRTDVQFTSWSSFLPQEEMGRRRYVGVDHYVYECLLKRGYSERDLEIMGTIAYCNKAAKMV